MGLDFFGDLLGIFHWGILHYQIKLSQDIQRMESHIVQNNGIIDTSFGKEI